MVKNTNTDNTGVLESILFTLHNEFPNEEFRVKLSCPIIFGDYFNSIEPKYKFLRKSFPFNQTIIEMYGDPITPELQLPFGGAGLLRIHPQKCKQYKIIDDRYNRGAVTEALNRAVEN